MTMDTSMNALNSSSPAIDSAGVYQTPASLIAALESIKGAGATDAVDPACDFVIGNPPFGAAMPEAV